jgi:hypothetical protein
MAKEALYLALDVSESMSPHLAEITESLQAHLCDKVLHAKTDAFGLALLGTAETANECADTLGGYGHISSLGEMKQVTADRIESLRSIQVEDGQADAMDGLVVASGALIQYVRKNKWSKRIVLISDGETVAAQADEESLTYLANLLVENKIQLDIVTVGALSHAATVEGSDVSTGHLGLQAAKEVWASLVALRERVDAIASEKGMDMPLVDVSTWEQLKDKWAGPYNKKVQPTTPYRAR